MTLLNKKIQSNKTIQLNKTNLLIGTLYYDLILRLVNI